jgi:NitT/TauT family transport system substrate-binding protein
MMANKLQFGMMGDYPLIVNGFTFENNPESKSRLIAVAAYSLSGSGNGIVVHKGCRPESGWNLEWRISPVT